MVHLVLSPKKAVRSTGVASSGVVALLVVAACGTPDAAPKPSPTVPTISTSAQVSSTPVPSNNAITVKPTPPTPTAEATTETPPPAQAPPPPPPPVETTDPTTERPRGPFAQQGAAGLTTGSRVSERVRPRR
jgi:hypothetical protein